MTSPTRWSGELPAPTEEAPGELTWTPGYAVVENLVCDGYVTQIEHLGELFLGRDNIMSMEVGQDELIILPEHLEPLATALLAAAEIVKQRKTENE